jgi:hypothetical protein
MDQEILVHIHNRVLLSHRNNNMGFESKWMQLEDIMLSEVSQDQKHKRHAFSFICGRWIQILYIYIYKNKHDHLQTQLNRLVTIESFYRTREREKGKDVKVKDVRMCIERC